MSETNASDRKQRDGLVTGRPWWRWNLITLAVALFVLIWARELSGAPLSTTWATVATVLGVWYLAPSPFAGVAPWPLLILGTIEARERPPRSSGSTPWSVLLCRFAAVVLVVGAFVQFAWQMYWVATQWQNIARGWTTFPGRGGTFTWSVIAIFWPTVQSLAIAIGLWTIADILVVLRRSADLFAYERRKDAMQREELGSSGSDPPA